MRSGAIIAFFTLMLPLGLARSDGNPCFDGDKTSDPRDDIRVHLFMNGGPANLKAVFALEAGANRKLRFNPKHVVRSTPIYLCQLTWCSRRCQAML